jgi:peptidoglycan hydrolase-like protein with peptidoglycan-binding domain
MRTARSMGRLGVVLLAAVALFAAGCSDDSSDNSSTTTTASDTTTTTKPGGPSSAVRALQHELDTLGCGAGANDGLLGPETEAAIRHFQAAAGLTVDGIVGVNTRAALAQAAQTGSPNCNATPPPATTTTSAGGSPACTEQAITAGVQAGGGPNGNQLVVNQYECSGIWATAQVTTPGPNGYEYTALLQWNGSAWQSVDRATYCDNGSVPQALEPEACESN